MNALKNIEIQIDSLNDLYKAVEQVVATGKKKIVLSGEMGAGKTTFTRAFCAYLRCFDEPSSPTFAIINQYRYPITNNIDIENHTNTNQQKVVFALIYHIDLYRLKNLEEALDIGIEDFLFDENYCLIEWAQLIEPLIKEEDFLTVSIEVISENARKITLLNV